MPIVTVHLSNYQKPALTMADTPTVQVCSSAIAIQLGVLIFILLQSKISSQIVSMAFMGGGHRWNSSG